MAGVDAEQGRQYSLRLATPDDAPGVQAIYAPIVRETVISFEFEPPTVAEMQLRIETTLRTLPWLVVESKDLILGYAYATKHRERAAYQWSTDTSVYVAEEARGRGIARRLYTCLFGMLEDLGYYNAFAGITLPNPASVGFHEAMGFQPIGIYHNVGHKFAAWHDVGWWQKVLREHTVNPKLPRAMPEYVGSDQLRERLEAA